MNRGRIQAQGGGTEKSEAWAMETDHHKDMGIASVDKLEKTLSKPEKSLRIRSLKKCRNVILTAPSYGISAQMIKSYWDDYRNRSIRVDIEVNSGIAFIDNPPKEN